MMTETRNVSPDARLTPAPNVCFADVGDQCCLLDANAGTYFMLNPAGAVVWRRLQEGESLAAVHQTLLAQFSVGADQLWRDLTIFVTALSAKGLVTVEPASGWTV